MKKIPHIPMNIDLAARMADDGYRVARGGWRPDFYYYADTEGFFVCNDKDARQELETCDLIACDWYVVGER